MIALFAAAALALPAPLHAVCPTIEELSRPWIEHTGASPQSILNAHLRSPIDGAAPSLVPVNSEFWWIGATRHGRGDTEVAPGCMVRGSAAFYVNGLEDSPTSPPTKLGGEVKTIA
ncbi:MAG: hypothetical protein ABL955_01865 [Elusimicrobiota bacterium]